LARADAVPDEQELRRGVADLIAFTALPATWTDHDPQHVAGNVAAALSSILRLEFVYVSSPGRRDEPAFEVTWLRSGDHQDSAGLIHTTLAELLTERVSGKIINPLGEGTVQVATLPIGSEGNASILAGSRDERFPTETQRLLLGLGASEIAAGLHRWQAEIGRQHFVALLEKSSNLIGFASLEGVMQYINPAGLAQVGLDRADDMRGLHVFDLIFFEERARVLEEFWPKVIREGRWAGEVGFRHFETGAAIPLLHEWFVIDYSRTGRAMNVAIISHDLSAWKRWESALRELNKTLERRVTERTSELAAEHQNLLTQIRERQRADARFQEMQAELYHAARLSAAGEMAAALAHELNQPLAAIANSVNAAGKLLAKGEIDTVGEIMDEAGAQVRRAGQIIHRLRDFVRRGDTDKRIESINAIIEDAAALAMAGSGALRVKLRFGFDPRASWALADRIQLQQVVANLMRNAIEAMAEQTRRELAVGSALVDGATIEISVADSGPGLDQYVRDRLFEPFVTTKRHGMGLGLSICRSIVEAHGGRLWCEPNPAGGTIFRFTLGAAPADGEMSGN
jgi:two-component system, LuxR family, sensor kinase FixL